VERHRLEEIRSSADQGLWVTLGFTSRLEANDVLHIVPGSSPDAADGLYLERFDQSYSATGGATSIVVRPTSVEIRLTEDARRQLAFESSDLVFESADAASGYEDAIHAFREMARLGYPIRVIDASS
jgi:hypothetical protein